MYYVYILRDDNEKIYIGFSANLERRMRDHNSQKVFTTKRMKNPKLFYYESYTDEAMAKLREKNLKRFSSAYYALIKRIGLR